MCFDPRPGFRLFLAPARSLYSATAADSAFLLFNVRNGEEIAAGKLAPEALAVHAREDFILEVDLRTPAPFSWSWYRGGCSVRFHAMLSRLPAATGPNPAG